MNVLLFGLVISPVHICFSYALNLSGRRTTTWFVASLVGHNELHLIVHKWTFHFLALKQKIYHIGLARGWYYVYGGNFHSTSV